MPFQGMPQSKFNPIEIALKIREMRSRDAADKEKMRIARIGALSAAKVAEDKGRRDQSAYEMKSAIDMLTLQKAQREAQASMFESTRTANENATSELMQAAPTNDLLNSPDGFSEIVNQLDPKALAPDRAQLQGIDQRNFGNIDAQLRANAYRVSAVTGESPGSVMDRLRSGSNIEGQTQERVRNRDLADAASKDDFTALARNKRIRSLIRQQNDAGSQKKRAGIQEDLNQLSAMRDADLTRGQPEELLKQRKAVFETRQDYNARLDQIKVLEGIYARGDSLLGPQADIRQLAKNIKSIGVDLSSVLTPSVQAAIDNEANSPEHREFLQDVFVFGQDPKTGELIEESRLEEIRTKWIILNSVNRSGRVNQKQIDDIGNTIRFTGYTVSSEIGKDRIRGAINVLKRSLPRLQGDVKFLSPSTQFTDSGSIVGESGVAEVGLTSPVRPGSPRPAMTPDPSSTGAGRPAASGNPILDLPSGFSNKDLIDAARQTVRGK